MEPDFWHERWVNNQIGFHEGRPNDYLVRFVSALQLKAGQRVFVPMCGKSVDLYWLAKQGYAVLGVELSPIAVQNFFTDHNLAVEQSAHGPFTRWRSGTMEILCGDFFALTAADLADVAAVYDRAALIALPENLRVAYAERLQAILPAPLRHLLVTLEYPQEQMPGPPFSVDGAEVRRLFGACCSIETLDQRDALAASPHLQAKGLTRLHENTFLLTRA